MTCTPCTTAKEFPEHRNFNPACLYCGARIIQQLGLLPRHPQEIAKRRRAMLEVWLQHGHSEPEIRALAKGPHCTGPEKATASARPPTTKRPSPGTKFAPA